MLGAERQKTGDGNMTGQALLVVGTLNRKVPYAPNAHGDGLSVFAFDEARPGFRRIGFGECAGTIVPARAL